MKYYITLFIFFYALKAPAQVLVDTTRYFESANAGTVKTITSKEVCAIVFFVSGPQSNWKKKNKKKELRKDEKAFQKLKKELTRFGINFDIHFEVFNVDQDFKVDSIIDYKKQQTLVKDHARKHSDYKVFNARKVWNHYSTSQIPFFKEKVYLTYQGGYFLILYHEGLGLSTAVPTIMNAQNASSIFEDEKSPEYINIFEFDTNWEKRTKYVTVHETLHLFGAWDLYAAPPNWEAYKGAGLSKEDYDYILEKYPKSIMHNTEEITIDEYTAWRIGINQNPEAWYFQKIPVHNHKSYYEKQRTNE